MKIYRRIIWMMLLLIAGAAKTWAQDQLLADVKELSSDKYQGRKTGTAGNKLAAEYIIKRFRQIGLKSFKDTYRSAFSFKSDQKSISGTNLVGYIEGKKQDVIVISAHYDHLGIIDGEIYNGADDNASGVAGLLSLAEYFSKHKPENTLLFAAFDAEEMGLQGAKAFVAAPPVPLTRIKINVNMDMISHNDKGELYVAGTYYSPQLKDYLGITNGNIKLLTGHDSPKVSAADNWTNQSDHYAFYKKNIPFLYFGVEDHKDYHRPTDDFDTINKTFFRNAVNAILEVVRNVDRDYTMQKAFRNKLIMK